MNVVLACDLGGTSFRAALVDEEGHSRAEHAIVASTEQDRLERSEIDPEVWWRALIDAAAVLAEKEPALFARIAGVAICGITRTQIFLGRDGHVLRPAITWRDARAERYVPSLLATSPASHPERENVNAFHPVARLDWLRNEEEAAFRSLSTLFDPKDFLNFRLTGRRASDPVSLARLAAAARPGPDGQDLLTAIGAPRSILPAELEPTEIVGKAIPGLPEPLDQLAGKPVFCCATDTWAAVVGLGALQPGYAYNISGTTEVFGVISETPAMARGLMAVDWGGLHQIGGPGQNGADTVAWLLSLLGAEAKRAQVSASVSGSVSATMEALLKGRRDPQPLLFLPYLQGERTPYWDAALRGAFVGLNRNHRGIDFAWAVLEGIAFLNRIVLERAEAALGRPVAEIRFGGGASANPIWRQIKADICERPVVVGKSGQPGVLGAAIVAWTGLGRYRSLTEAQQALAHVAHRHEPDRGRADTYRTLFELYRKSEAALAPVSHALAELARNASTLPGVHAPLALHSADRPL